MSRFLEVALYFCDGFLLETTYLIEGQSKAQAKRNALNLSNMVLQQLLAIKAPSVIVSASVLDATKAFQAKRQAVCNYAISNSQFSNSVNSDAESYVFRQRRLGRLGIPVDQAINLANSYVIFEVAAYAYFSELGYKVDAYVGDELPTLRKFVQGKFEQFPELEERACISLRVP